MKKILTLTIFTVLLAIPLFTNSVAFAHSEYKAAKGDTKAEACETARLLAKHYHLDSLDELLEE